MIDVCYTEWLCLRLLSFQRVTEHVGLSVIQVTFHELGQISLPNIYHLQQRQADSVHLVRFLPRDAMQAWPIYAVMRCLSVCLSVTFVHSVETNNNNNNK